MKKAFILILIACCFVLFSCAENADMRGNSIECGGTDGSGTGTNADTADETLLNATMPDDFNIVFYSWIGTDKNIYDTYTGTLVKDLAPGAASAEFAPDSETMAAIYDMLVACGIAEIEREMTSEVLADDPDMMIMIQPLTYYEITFTADGKTYTVTGDATAGEYIKTDTDAANFYKFVGFMMETCNDAFEAADMPPIVGGYE